ncbi:phage minor head protein [Streptomyces sp. NPDC057746]|uniref:phage minor head protein n=1 Tax=Streptomyces sp. NPDC057746 TaxID=3346237 RepID=UPI003686E909
MADPHQLLEQAEETVAEEVSAVLQEVADEFAAALQDADEIVAARFSVSRIARMFTDRMPRIVRRLLRVSEQAAQQAADDTAGELPPEWEDLPGRYDDGRDLPPAMSDYVDVTEHLLRAVGDRLAAVARDELAAGVDAGEDIEQLRARLRVAFAREGAQLGDMREERIARTEAGRAWNTATLGAARDATGTPAPIVKQWLSRRDDRVRHDHAEANGQIQLLDDPFTVGGIEMDAPHDPIAPASQCVNCRCILAVHPETSASADKSQEPSRSGFSEARQTAAADDGHLQGAMVALLPSTEDAARLALEGGEAPDELHCTMFFLADDASQWSTGERTEFIRALEAAVPDLGRPILAKATGTAHWNTDTDKPSWVWTISDQPEDGPTLGDARYAVTLALEDTHHPELPRQHSPWTAHTCGVYTAEAWPYEPMTERVGPVTFDRLRVAFGDEHTDIPLGPQQEEEAMPEAVQAAAALSVRTWSTPDDTAIAFEDQQTGDGRIFKSGALKWDRRPMPLQYADEMLMGHEGAELAGAIKTVKRDGNRITASGVLYSTRSAGADAIQLLDEEAPLGISVDLDDVDIEFVDNTLSPEDADWLFASARLPQASVLRLDDGSVMLSGTTRAEWTASDGAFSRSRYDLQLITGPGGALNASGIQNAFAGTGVLTAAAGDADDPEQGLVVYSQKSGEFVMRITRARLRGATLVAMPAFKDARIVLDPAEETAAATALVTATGDTRDRVVTYVCTSPAAVGARDVSNALGMAMSTARGHLNGAAKSGRIIRLAPGLFCGPSSMPEGEPTASGEPATDDELVASAWTALQDAPAMPAAWFQEPTMEELPPGSGGVHYKDGRVYGWVAQAGEPHAGFPGKNLTIDSLGRIDLTHFLRAKFLVDDGSYIKAGAFTMNVGHHRDGAECETASCQFDDTRTVAGVVTVGMNDRGLWFSGAAAPWLSEWDRTVFTACQPSYHLRQGADRTWQLRAVLSVPVPGHSSPLLATAVAERANLALAASAAVADTLPGQDQDPVRTESASSSEPMPDLPGQRTDNMSGQAPDIDVDQLIAALTDGPFVDLLASALERREADRRAELEAMAALVAAPAETTAQIGAN